MIEASLAIIFGLALLTFGADRFVDGAAICAKNLGIPPLLVGLTVVGFATSAPEMLVAGVAAYQGNPAIAVGNALGSNIANIGLVIGITALILPLQVRSRVLMREFPIMFVCLLLGLGLCFDQFLSFNDGAVLLGALVALFGVVTWLSMSEAKTDQLETEMSEHLAHSMSTPRALFWLLLGFALLLFGSHLLVDGAVQVATHFGVSDLIIGLTIVAIGTSLPELAASVVSALKGKSDIALGNVIGSNMFNVLGVLAVPALIRPHSLEPAVLSRDFPIMLGLSVALFLMACGRDGGRVSRFEGGVLLTCFLAYQWLLYSQN